MKRSCHGNNFLGGGTKGHVSFVKIVSFQDMEFHRYSSDIQ